MPIQTPCDEANRLTRDTFGGRMASVALPNAEVPTRLAEGE